MNKTAYIPQQEFPKDSLVRVSISMSSQLLQQFDAMIAQKNGNSRSQAISELIHRQLTDYRNDLGEETMAGTINLVYDHTVPDLQKNLAELQYRYLDEVISCLNVNLTHQQTMSVLLVQGPGRRLQQIADEIISRRGIITGKLLLSTAILPPVHPL
jgi:CopG family transcriptional regulator, nickel-responsive regulator